MTTDMKTKRGRKREQGRRFWHGPKNNQPDTSWIFLLRHLAPQGYIYIYISMSASAEQSLFYSDTGTAQSAFVGLD